MASETKKTAEGSKKAMGAFRISHTGQPKEDCPRDWNPSFDYCVSLFRGAKSQRGDEETP